MPFSVSLVDGASIRYPVTSRFASLGELMRIVSQLALLFSVLALVGCDKSGVHPLGRVRDNLGPCTSDTATWLRTTATGTELFLIGEATVESDGTVTPGCFAHGFVEHDSSTRFEYGTFQDDGSGTAGTFSYAAGYYFDYEPELSLLARHGADRDDFDPPITEPIVMQMDGAQMIMTYQGEPRRLTSILDVIDAVDYSTQEGAEDLFRLYNLPLFTSQVRILGFGSSGMTQYLDVTVPFAGTIENFLTVSVRDILNPKTDIIYVEFKDLTGITHDGNIFAAVGLSGSGMNDGNVSFRMDGNVARIRGDVSYADLEIRRGVAGGGTYTMTLDDGPSYVISYELAADIDLRGLLPESTP